MSRFLQSVWIYVSVAAGLVSGAFLASCGAAPSTDPANYSPGGYWTGSLNGEPGVGLVDESGEFTFIAVDGEQYPGTLVISGAIAPGAQPLTPYGASLSGSVLAFTPGGFPNYGVSNTDLGPLPTGILSGTIVPRQSIGGTVAFATETAAISLTFNALYYVPSSLATISGTYNDSATGAVFTINADGTLFAQDATTGCVINGTVSIINPSYNVYGVEVSYASCTGSLTPLNGVTLAGLAALDNTKSPEKMLAGVWSSAQLPLNPSITYTLVRF
jgi:hypothetical protein